MQMPRHHNQGGEREKSEGGAATGSQSIVRIISEAQIW